MHLTTGQFKLLSNFSNDIAKGLFLGSFLDAITISAPQVTRFIFQGFKLIIALLFLYLAILYRKEAEIHGK